MARFPRSLGDALAAQAEASRLTRTEALSVEPLAQITTAHIRPGDITTQLIATGAVTNTQLAPAVNTDLTNLKTQADTVDSRITTAINDNNAIPLTSDRFTADSLTVWPFVANTIPQGALAPGAVGESDIADFSIAVKKFKSDRHHLY